MTQPSTEAVRHPLEKKEHRDAMTMLFAALILMDSKKGGL